MHLGTIQIQQKSWRQVYHQGLGTFSVPSGIQSVDRERYECDHCGRYADVLGKAGEPFYCGGCGQLISIDTAATV